MTRVLESVHKTTRKLSTFFFKKNVKPFNSLLKLRLWLLTGISILYPSKETIPHSPSRVNNQQHGKLSTIPNAEIRKQKQEKKSNMAWIEHPHSPAIQGLILHLPTRIVLIHHLWYLKMKRKRRYESQSFKTTQKNLSLVTNNLS